MKSQINVLVTTNLPAPYSVEFFNLLAEKCNLTVVFYHKSSYDRDPSWFGRFPIKFNAKFLDEDSERKGVLSLNKFILSKEYDVCLIYGYGLPIEILAIMTLGVLRRPFIISIDGAILHKENIIKRIIKNIVISRGTLYLSPGKTCDEYLNYYGVKKHVIRRYHFASQHTEDILKSALSENQRKQIKEKLGIHHKKAIISVGNFIHRKGFDILLRAFKGIPENVGLYIVGGKPTEEYKAIIKSEDINNVTFVPHVGKAELEEYYKACDFCVFPTRYDIWGLVVNEALGCGLPVISTDRCVAALELIRDDYNGFIVPIEDVEALNKKMLELINIEDLSRYHLNSIESIQDYTLEIMAEEYYECINELYSHKH